jgi:hypothetical protein
MFLLTFCPIRRLLVMHPKTCTCQEPHLQAADRQMRTIQGLLPQNEQAARSILDSQTHLEGERPPRAPYTTNQEVVPSLTNYSVLHRAQVGIRHRQFRFSVDTPHHFQLPEESRVPHRNLVIVVVSLLHQFLSTVDRQFLPFLSSEGNLSPLLQCSGGIRPHQYPW